MISTPAGQYAGSQARRQLHERLLNAIGQKSMYFFQTTPSARIVNRFSADTAVIDKVCVERSHYSLRLISWLMWTLVRHSNVSLPKYAENNSNHSTAHTIHSTVCVLDLRECHRNTVVHITHHPDRRRLLFGAKILSILIEVIESISYKYFCGIRERESRSFIDSLYVYLQRRELQRIESISSAPILSHFVETIQGVMTIRAFNQESRFMEILFKRMEANNIVLIMLDACNRWLGIALVRI